MRKKLTLIAVLVLAALCPPARSQYVNSVRVYANEPNARFRVDGQLYVGVAEFLWPESSKHFVEAAEPQDSGQWGVRYEFTGWANNLNDSDSTGKKPITADAGLKWVQVNFSKAYLLTVSATPECPAGTPCPAPGRVVILDRPCAPVVNEVRTCWVPPGPVRLAAYPGDGAIFSKWTMPQDLSPQLPTTYIINVPVTGPTSVTAVFLPAADAHTTVDIQADPPEFSVVVDGTTVKPPVKYEWGWGTVHTVGVEPSQRSRGVAYAFHSWNDGGPINHEVRVPSPSQPITLTARFVPAHSILFQTSPSNLKLNIDGRHDWFNYAFGWLPGSVHSVSAPETQTDALGRKYQFVSWSNGKPASFEYTAGPAGADLRVIATYKLLGQATIDSSPSNLAVEVDGKSCRTPCVVERDAGATVRIVPAAIIPSGDQSRLLLSGWSDGGSANRLIELTPDAKTIRLNYRTQNRLSYSADPAEGASFVADPPSTDGFYDTGSVVSLAATVAPGFRIRGWSGDLTGTAAHGAVAVDTPKSAVLLLDRVPAIAAPGVQSAAGETPTRSVAPGSLIAIYGAHLAPELLVGPASPLAQTLASVTVQVGGSFLPLLFVSPGQINAQLVSGLEPGKQTLTVRVGGQTATSVDFEVSRNAPGLFYTVTNDAPAGLFIHRDSGAVSPERPAVPGETITVLGTGLGRYNAVPPDGFLVRESDGYASADPVKVIVDGTELPAEYAGRTSAGVGVDAIRFTLPRDLNASGLYRVKVVVSQTESNTVTLPIAVSK